MALNNLRHTTEFQSLASLITAEARGRQVFYAPNRGNWGDGLIHQGTVQFLKHYKIPYEQITRENFARIAAGFKGSSLRMKDSLLLAGGGGSWCNNYQGSRNFIRDHHHLFDKIIMMPATFELPSLDVAGDKITYVARDHTESRKSIPGALFCHDMAFFLQIENLNLSDTDRDGYFYRTDKEKHPDRVPVPDASFDISSIGNDAKDVRPFFQILSAYRTINTDRMHVAIACSMMGKPTKLTVGNYFKARAVYRSSIEPYFPKTVLMESLQEAEQLQQASG